MIEKCNFKRDIKKDVYHSPSSTEEDKVKIIKKGVYCRLTGINNSDCKGEENCIQFQTYKYLILFLKAIREKK